MTVTTTQVENGATTTQTVTSVQTGTFVAQAAVETGASSTSSSHNAAPTVGSGSVEALVIVGMVVMVAL